MSKEGNTDDVMPQRVMCNEGMAPKSIKIELHNSKFLVRHSIFKFH
jgi:hypothetical protein